MTELQQHVEDWLNAGRLGLINVGLSSKCMAMFLAFGEIGQDRFCPADPHDFDRCLKLLRMAPGLRPLLPKMAEVSEDWRVLVPRWDDVEASFLEEVGNAPDGIIGHQAPKTFALMRGILRPSSPTPPRSASSWRCYITHQH